MYQQLENRLLKSTLNERVKEELTVKTSFYGDNLDAVQLKVQLSLLQGQLRIHQTVKMLSCTYVCSYVTQLSAVSSVNVELH